MQPALIPSDLRRGVGRGIVVVIVVVGSPGPAVKSRPSFSFFFPLLTRASLDLPRVKSYGRTDGQVTQTDAAHLSRFEWSERDRRDRGTRGCAGNAEKKRERERGRERQRKRETGRRAVVGRAARPRRTEGEFSDEGDSPLRRGLPLAAVNLLLLFFLSAPFSLSRPSSRSSSASLFLSLRQTPGRENPLFLRSSFFHRFFISRLISRLRALSSLPLALS